MMHKQVLWKLLTGFVLLTLLFLCACSAVNPFVRGCTMVYCMSSLRVRLDGTIPDSYIVKASDPDGRTVIIQCKNVSALSNDHPHLVPEPIYPIADEVVKNNPGLLGLAEMCNSEAGFIKGNVAQCFEPEVGSLLSYSSCTNEGVIFGEFAPEELQIFVRWDRGGSSRRVQPEYSEYQPNGAGCEPICLSGEIVMDLSHKATATPFIYPPPTTVPENLLYPLP